MRPISDEERRLAERFRRQRDEISKHVDITISLAGEEGDKKADLNAAAGIVGSRDDEIPELRELAQLLANHEFKAGSQTATRDRIRVIGYAIEKRGGFDLMQIACYAINHRSGEHGPRLASALNALWDGIGSWLS